MGKIYWLISHFCNNYINKVHSKKVGFVIATPTGRGKQSIDFELLLKIVSLRSQ